jgi:sugar-specific transcriptional regulator TrmB
MQDKKIIEQLKSLGFREYDAKVFTALLNGKLMTVSEIAKESKIVRNSVYEIVKSFVEKGYCNEIETNRFLSYQIINPRIILDKIIKEHNEKHSSSIQLITDAFSNIQELYKSKSTNDWESENEIELIRGFNKHRIAKYIELFKNSKTEVLGMFRLKGVVTDELDKTASKLIKRGGTVKTIYQTSLNFRIVRDGISKPAEPEDLIRICESFEKYGEQVRLSQIEIPNISIFDREKIFINISEKTVPRDKQADIIIHNPNFCKHMIDLFSFYWDRAVTIEEYKTSLYKISS